MRNKFVTSALLLSLVLSSFAQSWTFSKGTDPFDGDYRTSSIGGSSTDATYSNPTFVFNHFPESNIFNIYLSGIGYFCDNVIAKFKFDEEPTLYLCEPSASNKQKVAFIERIYYSDENGEKQSLNKFEFLALIKKYSKMYLRIEDDCDKVSMVFPLSGSTKAIDFVYGAKKAEIDRILKAKEWRKTIEPGNLIEVRMNPGAKYISIYEEPTFRSAILTKLFRTDTLVTNSIDGDMVKVIINDSVAGWTNLNQAYPLK